MKIFDTMTANQSKLLSQHAANKKSCLCNYNIVINTARFFQTTIFEKKIAYATCPFFLFVRMYVCTLKTISRRHFEKHVFTLAAFSSNCCYTTVV